MLSFGTALLLQTDNEYFGSQTDHIQRAGEVSLFAGYKVVKTSSGCKYLYSTPISITWAFAM